MVLPLPRVVYFNCEADEDKRDGDPLDPAEMMPVYEHRGHDCKELARGGHCRACQRPKKRNSNEWKESEISIVDAYTSKDAFSEV